MARLSTSALHQLTDAKLLAAQANEGPTMENLTRGEYLAISLHVSHGSFTEYIVDL